MKKTIFLILDTLNKRRKNYIFLFLFLSLIGATFELMGFAMIIPIVNVIVGNEESFISEFLATNDKKIILFISICLFIFFFFIRTLYLSFLIWWQNKFTYKLQNEISEEIYKNYLQADYIWHLGKNSSKLIQIIISEVNQFSLSIGGLLFLMTDFIILFFILCFLFFVDLGTTILLLLLFSIYVITIHLAFKRKLSNWGEQRQICEQRRIKHIQESLLGIINNKIYDLNFKLIKIFNKLTSSSLIYAFKVAIFQQITKIWFELFILIAIFFVTIFNIFVLNLPFEKVIATLGIYTLAALRLIPIISKSVGNIQNLHYYKAPALITEKYLNINKNLRTNLFNYSFKNEIKLENIIFNYKENTVLEDINLKINYKDFVGIYGESGSGKSTLINIIVGLLKPSNGKVFIDSSELKENSIGWVKNIGYVPQKLFLNDETVVSNICANLNNEKDVNLNLLNEVLNKAELENTIDFKNKIVGENGSNLSGGQIQRVGIARALYKKPSILILDEPTTGLDSITELKIMETLKKINKNITIIIVTHSAELLKYCNKVFHLVNKKLFQDE